MLTQPDRKDDLGADDRGFHIRATFQVPRTLQAEFLATAEANDRTGAQEIRRFMREYIAANSAPKLLPAPDGAPYAPPVPLRRGQRPAADLERRLDLQHDEARGDLDIEDEP